jgi:hypothetical protein
LEGREEQPLEHPPDYWRVERSSHWNTYLTIGGKRGPATEKPT